MSRAIYRSIGETSRTAHDRFSEHRRAANRPLTYPDNALAAHYLEFHNNLDPDISFDILEINLYSTIKRKVTEAYYINLFKYSKNIDLSYHIKNIKFPLELKNEYIEELLKEGIFGARTANTSINEFQKRGLPHANNPAKQT